MMAGDCHGASQGIAIGGASRSGRIEGHERTEPAVIPFFVGPVV
jgi:hypothetical protein